MIHRQLGHADLGVTSVYLQGIDNTEVCGTPVAIVVSLLGALSR